MDDETFHDNLEGLHPLQIGAVVWVQITEVVSDRVMTEVGVLRGYMHDTGTNTLRWTLGFHPEEGSETGSIIPLDNFKVKFVSI
jgi:hypothetical protein